MDKEPTQGEKSFKNRWHKPQPKKLLGSCKGEVASFAPSDIGMRGSQNAGHCRCNSRSVIGAPT